MADLPTGLDNIDLTKGGFYTLINQLRDFLSGSIGDVGTAEGVKIALGIDSINNTSDSEKPISDDTQDALDEKQDTLVSSTNIKAINSQSLLGSGNLTLQTPLISGTNIKTINSESLLGSGDIEIVTTLTDSVSTTDSTTGASATAVKTAYDKGVSAYSLANSKLGSIPSSISSVGSYALVVCSNNTGAGATRSGSQLMYGGVDSSNSVSSTGSTLSGTWRMMGDSNSSNGQLTLAIRIS